MDLSSTLSAFDRQLRHELPPGDSATRVERTPRIVRHVSDHPHSWTGVVWSDLDDDTADAVIAAESRFFRDSYEWKYYTHDLPADLPERLRTAGLHEGELEAVMVAETAEVPDFAPPAGIDLVDVTDEEGILRAIDVHDKVFGPRDGALRERLLVALAEAPETVDVVLAVAGDTAVAAARTDYYAGTEFAGLWGGGTEEAWRGKGIYRALVSHRARRAQARGVRYLQVDALPTSEPILRRIGFTRLTSTRAFTPE